MFNNTIKGEKHVIIQKYFYEYVNSQRSQKLSDSQYQTRRILLIF
jgi:hypothetical protein